MKFAVYGKGGIGKSTISANISASLAEDGMKVLQIGCDPKHDSTRLLLGDTIPRTVMDYAKQTIPGHRRLEDILFRGYRGVACVEAGGPEPGVGCAGRGIITMFELLSNLGLNSHQFDVTLYDVLGDVVCGGFAVPVREEYADAVVVVTSGEYMSLYAANNILKGIQNFTSETGRIAGIIFNERGLDDEEVRVVRFANAVSLPIIAHIPKSTLFAQAEKEGKTILELFPESREASIFRDLSDHIRKIRTGSGDCLYTGSPLSDPDLEHLLLERKLTHTVESYGPILASEKPKALEYSSSVRNKRPLIGCAFAGAVVVTTQFTDAATIMHAPTSCSLMIREKIIGTEMRITRISKVPYHGSSAESLFCTNLSDNEFIHGGEESLTRVLEEVIDKGYSWIFIIPSCVPGLNGDRVRYVIDQMKEKKPGVEIIVIQADGNIAGDFTQGMILTYQEIFQHLPPMTRTTGDRSVTLVGERVFAPGEERNIRVIEKLLNHLVVTLNCRLLCRCSVKSLRKAHDSSLFLPIDHNDYSGSIRTFIESTYHRPFLNYPLPVGRIETEIWLRAVADVFDRKDCADMMIRDAWIEYEKKLLRSREILKGKTVLITTQRRSIDWILDLAIDLGMNVLRVGILYSPFNDTFQSRYEKTIDFCYDYDLQKRLTDIRVLKPDLVLYTYPSLSPEEHAKSDLIPYSPGLGFFAGIRWAERWSRIIKLPNSEGWRKDGGMT
nr:nitrogenase component 1 [uncultured Methanospirillum sp.]